MIRSRISISKQLSPARSMVQRYIHGPKEGATTQTKDFGEKEKAAENIWARQHDAEKLKAMQEQLHKKQEENEALKKELNELKNK